MSSKRTIVVVGATGTQGGSVVNKFLEKSDWNVRGITRNLGSDKAKAMAAKGVELVTGDLDDEASLVKAFEGADAIFAVTQWWELFATNGFDPHEAGKREYQQCLNMANAAAKTPTLKHYVWSTLEPTAEGIFVPHMDYKARSNAYIEENLKDLFAKTTFLVLGYYASNIEYVPMLKPVSMGPYSPSIQILPVHPTTLCPSAGDVGVNTGIFVSAIVDQPQLALPGKIAIVQTDWISLEDQLKLWSEITGKPMLAVQLSPPEAYTQIWGPLGVELDLNFQAFTYLPDGGFNVGPGKLTGKSLGIESQLHDTKKAFENLYAQLNAPTERA